MLFHSQLAFARNSDVTSADNSIYLVNTDGTGLQRVVYVQSGRALARWSPDGAFLLYSYMAGFSGGAGTIMVDKPDGSEVREVTWGWGAEWEP